MIQDMGNLDITYKNIEISDDDYILVYNKNNLLFINDQIPKYKDIKIKGIFGFSFNGQNYFISNEKFEGNYKSLREIRAMNNMISYIAYSGYHLSCFLLNKYCPKCGAELIHSDSNHELKCNLCNNLLYPKIAPAVIVGIINGDKLLLTKYADGIRNNYALVSGYCEFGESFEQTIKREIAEEVGLKVKNIRYFANQPWGVSEGILVGFFCDLDGSDKLSDNILEFSKGELKEARWFEREEIEEQKSLLTLTSTMIEAFRRNEL